MIKNIVAIVLIIAVIAIMAVLGVALLSGDTENPVLPNNSGNSIGLDVVAQHNSSSDCWVVVNQKVYNVTNFLALHPAGPDKIIPFCGKDATDAFNTRGGIGPHPESAQATLSEYYVGEFIR